MNLYKITQRADASVGKGRLHPALPVEGDGRSPVVAQLEQALKEIEQGIKV